MSEFKPTREEKENFMLQAVELAKNGRGYTAPNPCVGALLVHQGKVVAREWHRAYGQAHAEINVINACRQKGIDPSRCSLYVTLEPCNHQGKTPPCTQAILKAGIKEVFIGTEDPNQQVTGKGLEFLRSQGLKVESNIAEQVCQDLIRDFWLWNNENRAFVFLKLAATLDAKIATSSGSPAWISCAASREEVHKLRNRVQAVLIGKNTLKIDNPKLTCRLKSYATAQSQPLAIIACTELPCNPEQFQLIQKRPEQVIFWSSEKAAAGNRAEFLRQKGCRIWSLPELENGIDLKAGLKRLFSELSIYYLLCEGGGTLAMHILKQGLGDEFWYFLAPYILGDQEAKPAFCGRQINSIQQALSLRLVEQKRFEQDLLLKYMPA